MLLSNLLVEFALAPWVCGNGRQRPLYGIELGFLLITLIATWLAGSYWRRVGTIVPTESASPHTRIRFMVVIGLLINALSALQIIGAMVNSFIWGLANETRSGSWSGESPIRSGAARSRVRPRIPWQPR